MKKIFILAMLIGFTASCYSPERNCTDFKTGTFEFKTYLNGEMTSSTFTRTNSIEIERYQGKTDTSSVRWINDCEYVLKNINPKSRSEKKPIHIKILTTTKTGYTFEYGLVGDTQKAKGTVTKIK